MTYRSFVPRFGAALMLALAFGGAAHAKDDMTKSFSKSQPVLLIADKVDYEEHTATAIATGHVQVIQGDSILYADKVTYNQNTDSVHAYGHVSLLQPSGDVMFADEAELHNQMQQGVVQQFKARFKDNSLFAAREGHRINKDVTKLKDAVYSPCHICQAQEGEKGEAPMWQITADKATIDENEKRVTYQNALMDVYGMPVLYTPYFSHPTPDAPNESGLLQPQYFHDSTLGSVIKEPAYYTFAPNLDMTLTPWYMTGENPLLEGEFRGLSQNGSFYIHAAAADAYNRDDTGDVIPGDWFRGFVEAHGKYQINQYWDAGLDAEHVSDDTFLQFYHFGWQDLLTSRLYTERIENRDYFSLESLAFQGLQPADQPSASPYILPEANLHLESDPMMAHSRFMLDGNALELTRSVGDTDQRVSSTAAWKLPYITQGGQVFEIKASLRGDAYHVNDQVIDPATNAQFNGDTGRFIPQVDGEWRYPLIRRFEGGQSIMVAPTVMVAASPDLGENKNIPNEDSQIAELSDINLFSPDRFSGLDQVESGPRGAYGMRGQMEFANEKYLEWLFGQAYQQNVYSPFPLANGEDIHSSDYIGRVAMKYEGLDVAYSFRLDRETLNPTSNEVGVSYGPAPFRLDITYLSLENEPLFGDRKEVFGSASVDLAEHWMLNVGGRRDLGSSEEQPVNTSLPVSSLNPLEPTAGTVGINTGLVFHNECVMITTLASRSYITQEEVRPSTTFGVTLVFKNFGAQGSGQNAAANMAGAGNNVSVQSEQNPVNPPSNLAPSGNAGSPIL